MMVVIANGFNIFEHVQFQHFTIKRELESKESKIEACIWRRSVSRLTTFGPHLLLSSARSWFILIFLVGRLPSICGFVLYTLSYWKKILYISSFIHISLIFKGFNFLRINPTQCWLRHLLPWHNDFFPFRSNHFKPTANLPYLDGGLTSPRGNLFGPFPAHHSSATFPTVLFRGSA